MAENRVRFRADLDDKVSGKLSKIRDNFDRLGKSKGAKVFLQGVGLGVGQSAFNLLGSAASAAGDFIGDSIRAASDLNETLSKSRVVFGSAAGGIEEFGNSSAKALGISKNAAVGAAATFGNLFTGLGKGQGEAAAMSKTLVALASDLASFNNMDPTDVLEKLRAGLAGEAEPLRSVGVFLNEAKVKAKAMELGLADANGEISDGAKITARYNLILQETTTAQGDFARTADALANSQRTANAQLEDAQGALGQKLLPAQLEVTKAQIDLFTSLETFGDMMAGKTTPETIALAAVLGRLSDEQAAAAIATLDHRRAMQFMAGATKDDRIATDQLTASQLKAEEATEEFSKDLRTAKQRADDLKDALRDAATSIIADYYDPIQMKEERLENKRTIAAAKRILESSTATKAEKADAKAQITDAQRRNDELAVELLRTGKLSKKSHDGLIDDLKERLKTATGAEKKYIKDLLAEIRKLDGVTAYINIVNKIRTVGVGATVHAGGFAEGGYIPPNRLATVGEEGPETIMTGRQGATVFPNGAGPGGNMTFVYSPTYSTASPAEAQAFASAAIPGLVREMRRQRLVA